MDGSEDPRSYFSAAQPKGSGLDEELAKLKQMQQAILANRQSGSPSRGPLLQQPNVILPTTGAAPYLYVDPNAGQVHEQQLNNLQMLKQFQLLPPDAQKILMNTKALPRFAGERDDLLKDTEDTFYGGGHGQPRPTPTPTPQPTRFFPVSYFT